MISVYGTCNIHNKPYELQAAECGKTIQVCKDCQREQFDRFAVIFGEQQPQPPEGAANNVAHPFDKLPDTHAQHVELWLTSNQKSPSDVRWSLYPLGMVGRWIERAEQAETERDRLRIALFQLSQMALQARGELKIESAALMGQTSGQFAAGRETDPQKEGF